MPYDVITVGSATIDAFADTESELIKIMTTHSEEDLIAYPVGTKILIKELRFLTGGGGTNTACSFARLGLKTGYLGTIGKDHNGGIVLDFLKKEGIDFLGTRVDKPTGFSVILDSIEDDRTILTHKGANDYFSFASVNRRKLRAEWFYFSAMTGKAFNALCRIASFAEKNGIKIAFNPSSYLAERGKQFLKPVLSRTNLLVLNREEAQILVGKEDIAHLLEDLRNLIAEDGIVVITDGRKGADAFDGSHHWHIDALKVKVKETTGAGDAFASSFLAGLIKKNDMEFALKLAVTNSASVVRYAGAKEKLLKYREALAQMKKTRYRITKKKLKNG
ncbi:carbohydrate kinase family protein [Candidatus Woesearchaeota archaeon]|nr:MAG: carbohydrate kinase family protein [Candidatus Woesearchaeota archaeon]